MRAKPAVQARSREKHQRILEAMAALLEDKSFEEVTIAEIARQAGIPAGTIYQRFRNQDAAGAILLELFLQRSRDWATRPRSAPPPADLHEALLRIGGDAWDQVEALGHIMRPAYLYSRRFPARTGPEWQETQALAEQGFRRFLDSHSAAIGLPDLDEAAETVGFIVNLMTAGLLLHGETNPPLPLQDRDRFAHTLADLVCRYLTPKPEAS